MQARGMAEIERRRGEAVSLRAERRRQRRLASASFFVAGVGFGTALYLLRARFATLGAPGKPAALLALVGVMALAFWLGARAEAEVTRLDERLRDLDGD
jgi:hypothetical protein